MRMLIAFAFVALWVLTPAPSNGQIKATKAGSLDALERIQKQQDAFAAAQQVPGELNVAGLKVGASGRPAWIDAKVMQVIDDKTMLLGLEDSRTGNGRYSTWVMLKAPTAGITDGRFWRGGGWKAVTGSETLLVTGTTTYKTTGGGSKTVFVVENPDEADKERKRVEKAKADAEKLRILAEEEKAEADKERTRVENDKEKRFALMEAEVNKLRSEAAKKAEASREKPTQKKHLPPSTVQNAKTATIEDWARENWLLVVSGIVVFVGFLGMVTFFICWSWRR